MKWYRGGIAHCNGRKPGVACNKHQGRELKTSTISFQNPLLRNMHQTTTSNKNETRFPCYNAKQGSTAPNLRLTSPHPSFLSPKIETDHKIRRMGSQRLVSGRYRSTHGGCPPQACSKQTCAKRARLQSDCRKKQLTIDP